MSGRNLVRRWVVKFLCLSLALQLGLLFDIALAQERIRVDFWDQIWGPPIYAETAESLVKEFNNSQNEIEVVYRSVPWANWYQTYLTAVLSKTAPCISTGASYQAAQLYDFGGILPIDDFIDELRKSGEDQDFVPGVIDALVYDGHYLALPWGIDIRCWYYRKDLFENAGVRPPNDWNELMEAAKKLTRDNKYAFVTSGTGPIGIHLLLTFIFNNDGYLFTPEGKLDFANPNNVQALRFLADLVKLGTFHPASISYDDDQARGVFARGDAAITLGTPGEIHYYPDIKDKVGLLPPFKSFNGTYGAIQWVNNIMLYTNCKNPDAAKKFLKWWSSNQLPLWLRGGVGQIPVRKSFLEDPYFQDNPDNPMIKDIIANYLPIGKTMAYKATGFFPLLNEIDGAAPLRNLLHDILLGKDLDESIARADKDLQELAAKY